MDFEGFKADLIGQWGGDPAKHALFDLTLEGLREKWQAITGDIVVIPLDQVKAQGDKILEDYLNLMQRLQAAPHAKADFERVIADILKYLIFRPQDWFTVFMAIVELCGQVLEDVNELEATNDNSNGN